MRNFTKSWRVLALIGLTLGAAACDEDNGTGPNLNRTYDQIERLGNPLVSEVMFAKRNHGFHNTTSPSMDVANFATELKAFVANVAGRNTTVQNTLAAVLLPDMLIVQTDKADNTAGWLSWALANGWGGRNLSDDVVDAGLMAIFGSLLDPNNTSPGLSTDNVAANDAAFSNTFPYLAAKH
ncbi:MAG: DUF4331 family protein [Gemmatimonadetes bacterium]|nr:DUF4331 family protein [Gemmatimonadota bacterium]